MPGGRQFGADNPWDRKDDPVEKTPLPIEQIALRLDESGLTPAQQLELGLTLDQAKVLFVASGTDAFSLAATIDAAGLTHILIRDDDGRLGSILDIEWAKSQARNFLEAPQIQSFQASPVAPPGTSISIRRGSIARPLSFATSRDITITWLRAIPVASLS